MRYTHPLFTFAAIGIAAVLGYNALSAKQSVALVPVASSLARGAIQADSPLDPACGIDQVKQVGYSATVRPAKSLTDAYKLVLMKQQGIDWKERGKYEGDHAIPVSLCGCPGPGRQCNFEKNFQLQLWAGPDGARAKDRVELRMLSQVRSGKLNLLIAQRCLLENWKLCP